MKMERNQLRTIIIAVVIVIIGAAAAIYVYTQKESELRELMSKNTNLTKEMTQKDSIMNDLELTFNEIENRLKLIKEKRNQIAVRQVEGGKDKKQALIDDVNLLNTMLEESSTKIEELERKLKQSGLNLKAFEQRVASLNESIENQNIEIAELKRVIDEKDFQMAELNTRIEKLDSNLVSQTDTIQVKQRLLEERTNQLNTGHFASGTRKELMEKGLLTKEGGFLGFIGKTRAMEENFDEEHFTALDIRETTTIPLHSKKATVISEHPDNSYSLVEEDGQVAYLEIKDPEQFWKISKYALIEVK
jgi:peptidoglycan hydrolase CwlO-like protein